MLDGQPVTAGERLYIRLAQADRSNDTAAATAAGGGGGVGGGGASVRTSSSLAGGALWVSHRQCACGMRVCILRACACTLLRMCLCLGVHALVHEIVGAAPLRALCLRVAGQRLHQRTW